ncbi:type II secretion system GspH family protein [Fusobacteria bacterium ZRK30]|nr:type II secretion system GspH family protein [Fusobacteria bacterium ZRK30]
MKKLKQGFTLIELLVVIAVIGILATTLAPKLREQLAKGKDAKVIAALGTGRTAISTISFEKMVNTDTNNITITYDEFRDRLDKKSRKIFKEDDGDIWVGGSRKDPKTDPNSPIKYNMNLTLSHVYKNNEQGEQSFNKTLPMIIDDDETLLFLSPRATPNGYVYSIEGKKWIDY